ncbi:MAG TPA: energy transducer TonB, partial [Aquabacterium sp.]|nr:energy transducer TonB [Aquabacterium sp.]
AKPKVEKEQKKHPKKEPKEVFLPDPPKKVPPKPEVKPEKPVPAKPQVDPKAAAKAKAAEEAQAKREAEKLAAQRRANLDRLMRNLAQDQVAAAGLSESYTGRLVARIRPNIVFSQSGSTNFKVLVRVECSKDGKITRSTILAPSGSDRWDDAVLRALDRTQVLPTNENKIVPCPFDFVFNSQDF